jgi:DNA modification methylase
MKEKNIDNELPIEALPNMVRIMNYFHLALTDEIKNFEEEGDKKKFHAILIGLKEDLMRFENRFNDWLDEAVTSPQHQELKEFETCLQNARDLVSLAEQYLVPVQ